MVGQGVDSWLGIFYDLIRYDIVIDINSYSESYISRIHNHIHMNRIASYYTQSGKSVHKSPQEAGFQQSSVSS